MNHGSPSFFRLPETPRGWLAFIAMIAIVVAGLILAVHFGGTKPAAKTSPTAAATTPQTVANPDSQLAAASSSGNGSTEPPRIGVYGGPDSGPAGDDDSESDDSVPDRSADQPATGPVGAAPTFLQVPPTVPKAWVPAIHVLNGARTALTVCANHGMNFQPCYKNLPHGTDVNAFLGNGWDISSTASDGTQLNDVQEGDADCHSTSSSPTSCNAW